MNVNNTYLYFCNINGLYKKKKNLYIYKKITQIKIKIKMTNSIKK